MTGETIFTLQELNTGFVVAINIVAKDGLGDAVAAILHKLVSPTLAEPGTKVFLPYRSATDPNAFFVYELYRDEHGWAEHQATDHFKTLVGEMLPLVERRERLAFMPYVANEALSGI